MTNKEHPLYDVWCNMKSRCYNPRNAGFKNYGGRGIAVCEEWRASFQQFVEDMPERPEGYVLDRIDVDGDYEPSNCRWVTVEISNQNRRVRWKEQCIHGHDADEYGFRDSRGHQQCRKCSRASKSRWNSKHILSENEATV